MIRLFLLFFIILISVKADEVLIRHNWTNLNLATSKEGILAGATTATAKGYSAILVNPAGIGSNNALGIYTTSASIIRKDDVDRVTMEVESKDTQNIGVFYKNIVVEHSSKYHSILGSGYSYESNYGLFSVGGSYLKDNTEGIDEEKRLLLSTGDFYTLGVAWQKSFVEYDGFKTIYFGFSMKGKGVNLPNDKKIGVASPKVTRIGLGFETNVFQNSILITYNNSKQEWADISETIDSNAFGIKWMIFNNFALSVGSNTAKYSGSSREDKSTTLGSGIEVGFWNVNLSVAILSKETIDKNGKTLFVDDSSHLDIALAF